VTEEDRRKRVKDVNKLPPSFLSHLISITLILPSLRSQVVCTDNLSPFSNRLTNSKRKKDQQHTLNIIIKSIKYFKLNSLIVCLLDAVNLFLSFSWVRMQLFLSLSFCCCLLPRCSLLSFLSCFPDQLLLISLLSFPSSCLRRQKGEREMEGAIPEEGKGLGKEGKNIPLFSRRHRRLSQMI